MMWVGGLFVVLWLAGLRLVIWMFGVSLFCFVGLYCGLVGFVFVLLVVFWYSVANDLFYVLCLCCF